MDIRQLRYFVTIADEGGISAAARKLYMTQPPLSSQMSLLEKELETPLFFRTYEGVHLTEAGKLLYHRAKDLLLLVEQAAQDVKSAAHGKSGILRVGMVSSVSGSLGIEWICAFSRMYPDISVEISEANTYSLIEQVRENLVRAAVVRTPFRDCGLPATPLSGERLIAILPETVPQIDRPANMHALSAHPLLIYRRWEHILRQRFDALGLPMDVRCLCDDARTAVRLAEQGMGVCIAPASSLCLARGGLCAVEIPDMDIRSDIVLLSAADLAPDEPAALFAAMLREGQKSGAIPGDPLL